MSNGMGELIVPFENAVEQRLAEIEARASIPGEAEKMPFVPEGEIRRAALVAAVNDEAHRRFWAQKGSTANSEQAKVEVYGKQKRYEPVAVRIERQLGPRQREIAFHPRIWNLLKMS
ncbi:hypothetical protein EEL32_25405 [Brevibacillus laterosporus]|nr:hypothetical protein [Brevibacillus laterosporus]TPG73997.1 hypothetical protein EEL32_25405 [Brevibacillus laterosporus]